MYGNQAWGEGAEEAWPYRRGRREHGRGPGRRARGFGPPGFGMPGFPPWPGDPRLRRGPRVRRGDVRAAALALLAEEPRNGYQIIQAIAERSGGVWQPSPGSVYPALQQLEDEGLIQTETADGGRKHYTLTSEGREYVAAHPEEVQAPWEAVARSVDSDALELRRLFGEVMMAASQVDRVGSDEQIAQAHQIMADARRKLYRILAADEQE